MKEYCSFLHCHSVIPQLTEYSVVLEGNTDLLPVSHTLPSEHDGNGGERELYRWWYFS